MFYIFAIGMGDDQEWVFVATCVNPVVASEYRKSGYFVSRCINITKISLSIGHHLKLVK